MCRGMGVKDAEEAHHQQGCVTVVVMRCWFEGCVEHPSACVGNVRMVQLHLQTQEHFGTPKALTTASWCRHLSQVRAELAPWEAQMAEVQSRMNVATSERDLLLKQQQDAKGELLHLHARS